MSKKEWKNKKTRSKQYQAQDKKERASSDYQTLKSGAKVAKKKKKKQFQEYEYYCQLTELKKIDERWTIFYLVFLPLGACTKDQLIGLSSIITVNL